MGRPVKPIASIGCDLPLGLLAATGRYAGALDFDADRPTPWAERWLESKFAPWTFQILEDWQAGALDHLDAIVFSRGDDSCQRLYYYVCELRRIGEIGGPEPIIFDVAHIRRPTSVDATIAAVRALADRLGVAASDLSAVPVAAPTSHRPLAAPDARTCLIAGTLPPDRRLHRAIEAAGWSADGETLPENWRVDAGATQGAEGDPFDRIGRGLHEATSGPRSFHDRIEALTARIHATGAKAACLWFCEHDEAEAWHAPSMRRALEAESLPCLMLTRRDWRATDGAIEELGAFLRNIRS